jgi:hypothetical protein
MAEWFQTGRYIANTTRQREAFGATTIGGLVTSPPYPCGRY